jgi:predicted permease
MGELLVAGACVGGFLGMRRLLATPRCVEQFVAFFFAGMPAAYMSIQVCALQTARRDESQIASL